jgi:hypothetical protein
VLTGPQPWLLKDSMQQYEPRGKNNNKQQPIAAVKAAWKTKDTNNKQQSIT